MRACSLTVISLLTLAGLALGAAAQPEAATEVRVVFVRDGVFGNPVDSAWLKIPEATFNLNAQ